MSVTATQIRNARQADLFEYLCRAHPDEIKREGQWLRMKNNPSLLTKKGYGGYKDYSSLETGNSIDFLVMHMNYDFVTAVTSLTGGGICTSAKPREPPTRTVVFPEKAGDDRKVRSYLGGRGFTKDVLDQLIESNLLYQDIRQNAVFCNADKDFFELRGTWSGKTFHQCRKARSDCYWCFAPNGPPQQAYVCEGAIDAVSLYLIHLRKGDADKANAYCGIAGVANQRTIERISRWIPTVIAVDNDEAGEQCRLRNSGLPALIPYSKDWNEDLIAMT